MYNLKEKIFALLKRNLDSVGCFDCGSPHLHYRGICEICDNYSEWQISDGKAYELTEQIIELIKKEEQNDT